MSPDTLLFLFGFTVIAGVSLVPAVQQELAERRHSRRVLERHERRGASADRETAT